MSVSLPNGVIVSIGTTLAAAKAISGISNANPAVATSNAHGYANGDMVLINSGWQRLNDRLFRVADQAANNFKLDGADTANVALFPPGTGGGTAKQVTGWTQIQQILESTSDGGEMQFTNFSFLEDDYERRLPTTASAQGLTLNIADDPLLAGYQALKAAAEDRSPRPIRFAMPNGGYIYYFAVISFNETPSMTKNEVMACQATLSLQSRPVRYAA